MSESGDDAPVMLRSATGGALIATTVLASMVSSRWVPHGGCAGACPRPSRDAVMRRGHHPSEES